MTRIVGRGVAVPATHGTASSNEMTTRPTTRNDKVLAAQDLGKQVSSPEGTLAILATSRSRSSAAKPCARDGASGAGKSTLLALLAGLDEPTTGQVWLVGPRAHVAGRGRARRGPARSTSASCSSRFTWSRR
jgi:ABC-type glutathione transport system ATPase component